MASTAKRRKRRRNYCTGEQSRHCTECDTRDKEIQTLKERLDSLQRTSDEWKERCTEVTKSRDDALTRLSAVVSSRLRDNNPNICDLSDLNRPTKIAERMSELYDNEWTDAYDELENIDGNDEATCVNILLDALMSIYRECLKWATESYMETVQGTIESRYTASGKKKCPEPKTEILLPTELQVEIKQFRKRRALDVLPSVQKMLSDQLPLYQKDVYQTPAMRRFVTGCEHVSWLAAVQDPPLVIEGEPPVNFQRDLYREFTRAGPHVEYVVWPLLRIEKGGALLSKGVAQCCKLPPGESSC